MTTVYGPATADIPNGYSTPINYVYQGVLNPGDSVTFRCSASYRDPGITRGDWDLYIFAGVGGALLAGVEGNVTLTNQSISYTATGVTPFACALLGGGGSSPGFDGTATGVQVDVTLLPGGICQYGTRLKPTADAVYTLTPELIAAWLAARGVSWLGFLLSTFANRTLNAELLCSAGPPPLPTIDLSTLTASAETLWQILEVIAWSNVCECVPGAPSPTPPPLPSPTQPTGWPAAPTFPCDPAALCNAIAAIGLALQRVERTSSTALELLTIVQRYGLPFAYVRGRRFSAISGSGTHELGRCVGLLIEVTSWPATAKQLLGAPPYIYDLGWISVLTDDGMLDEIRLTRQAMTWSSKLIPTATLVGWGLRDDVVIDVSELLAEA